MSDQNIPPSIPVDSQAGAPASETRLSKCSLWSLILGILSILGLFLLTSLPSIILGIVGLVQVAKPEERLHGKGFAISGLALSVVSVILFPIFMVILSVTVPAVSGVRQSTFEVKNTNSMRQITMACQLYALEHDGSYPDKLQDLVPDFLDIPDLLQYDDPANPGSRLPFHYVAGATDAEDPDTLLLAAPMPLRGERVVAYLSGRVTKIPEEEYQALVK